MTARRHRQAERAERPRPGQLAEEDVAQVLAHQRAAAVGLGAHPGDDRLHRRPARRQDAALAQQPADGDIFAAVLVGIADAHDRAVGQPQPPGALDLEEEQVDRVGRPGDLQPLAGQRAVLDLGAR